MWRQDWRPGWRCWVVVACVGRLAAERVVDPRGIRQAGAVTLASSSSILSLSLTPCDAEKPPTPFVPTTR